MLLPILLGVLIAQAAAAQNPTPPTDLKQVSLAPDAIKPEQPWPPAGVFRAGPDVTEPELLKDTKPMYTAAAMRAKIQGAVVMEAVVLTDGTVGDVRVTRSLDKEHGLDDEAVKTVKDWRFVPGKRDGAAVPVLVDVKMTFTLRK